MKHWFELIGKLENNTFKCRVENWFEFFFNLENSKFKCRVENWFCLLKFKNSTLKCRVETLFEHIDKLKIANRTASKICNFFILIHFISS